MRCCLRFFFLCLFLAIANALYSQSLGSFDPSGNINPSAETFAVSKYGKLSPAMYTGAMTYSLPLFTYEDPEFSISINLSGYPLPKNDTKSTDHWGYWNGKSVSSIRTILKTQNNGDPVSDLYDQINGTCKEADSAYSLCGALTSITYPTGGTSSIEYEGNTVSRRRTLYADAAVCTPYEVGGIRVKRFTHSTAGYGSMEDHVTYYYSDTPEGTTSGILSQMPRYAAAVNTHYENTSSFGLDARLITFSGAGTGFPSRDGHIGYSAVIEKYEDGSWQRFSFSSAAQVAYCDANDYEGEEIPKRVFGRYDAETAYCSTPLLSPPNIDRRNMRGQIITTELFRSDGVLRKRVSLSYSEDAVTLQGLYVNTAAYYNTFHWSARSPRLSTQAETSFETGGSLVTTRTLSYNSRGQVVCDAVAGTVSAGTVKTYYQYLADNSPSTAIPAAQTAIVTTRSFGSGEKIASKQTLTYSGSNIHPAKHTQYYIQVPPTTTSSTIFTTACGDSYKNRTTSYMYDYRYRLTRVSFHGGDYITYVWNGNHISQKKENGAKTTAYTWKDQVGLASVTAPGGQAENYTYDGRGRLQFVRDADNSALVKYTYFFNNDPGSSSSIYYGGDNYVAEEVYTSANGVYSYKDVTYYNGLGYEEQRVGGSWVSSWEKLVQPIVYDAMRRPDAVEYLPYIVSSSFPEMEADAVSAQAGYYQNNYSETRAYRANTYEETPEGRPLQATKEGTSWTSHPAGVTYRVSSSADSLLRFSFYHSAVNPTVSKNGRVAGSELLCTVETDEDGREVRVFTDNFNRVLCSRTITPEGDGRHADTYYVYDLRDSLVCVIPPEAASLFKKGQKSIFTFGDSFSSGNCFLTWRDGLGWIVGTSAPGGGRITTDYYTNGRIHSVRSAAMDASGIKKVFQYDAYGRITNEYVRDLDENEEVGGWRYYSYYDYSGSGTSFGTTYAFVPDEAAALDEKETTRIKGFLKHEMLRPAPGIDGTSNAGFIRRREYYYDKHGRVIQTVEVDSDGWKARYSTRYDFRGDVIKMAETHFSPSGDSTVLVSTYTRDSRGRVLTYARNLNGTLLSNFYYTYDNMGRLSKLTAGAFERANTYDIHGWLTQSKVTYLGTSLFQENLRYSSPVKTEATALWSGRVSETASTLHGRTEQTYAYHYDNAWRLTSANHFSGNAPVLQEVETGITHDLDGNALAMKRYGESALEDDLTFTYTGGRLISITDAVDSQTYTYSYDANGDMTSDGKKGIQISYNVLNLPDKVMSGTSILAKYEYLIDGSKVSALSGSGAGYKYRGNFLYVVDASGNEQLESIGCDESRIVVIYSNAGVPSYKDYWPVKDHLGSVRTVMDLTTPGNVASKKKEQSDYLTFGTRVARSSTTLNHWRFSGKEEQNICGTDIGLLDFGARYYDPWLSRWITQDPMAHKYAGINPYVYCNGDPVNMVDIKGMSIDDFIFNKSGRYVGRIQTADIDRIVIQSEEGPDIIAQFADVKHDPDAIGMDSYVIFVSDETIASILENSGVNNQNHQGLIKGTKYLLRESDNANLAGEGRMDYIGNGKNLISPERAFYVTYTHRDGFVAHNGYNYGNFLWGAGVAALKIPLFEAIIGSNFYALRRHGELDSRDDQFSIQVGYRWQKAYAKSNKK